MTRRRSSVVRILNSLGLNDEPGYTPSRGTAGLAPSHSLMADDNVKPHDDNEPIISRRRMSSIGKVLQHIGPRRGSVLLGRASPRGEHADGTLETGGQALLPLSEAHTPRVRRSSVARLSAAFDPGRIRMSRGRLSISSLRRGSTAVRVAPSMDCNFEHDLVQPFTENDSDDEWQQKNEGQMEILQIDTSEHKLSGFGLELLDRTSMKPTPRLRLPSAVEISAPTTPCQAEPKRQSLLPNIFPGLRLLNVVAQAREVQEELRTQGESEIRKGEFETPALKAKRRWLRFKPQIREQIARLWEIVEKENNRMLAAEYLDYHLSAYHVIKEEYEGMDAFDESEEWEAALTDLRDDLKGATTLTFELFFESVFELADLWTNSVRVNDYVRFLKLLVKKGTRVDPVTSKAEWVHRWPREPYTNACKQWVAIVREHWLSLVAVKDKETSNKAKLSGARHGRGISDSTAPVTRSPPRHALPRVPGQQNRKHSKQLVKAAKVGMRALGAMPTEDGTWPVIRLAEFKAAIGEGKYLPKAMRERVKADMKDRMFGHALFRWCDVDGDGRLSLEDLADTISRKGMARQ